MIVTACTTGVVTGQAQRSCVIVVSVITGAARRSSHKRPLERVVTS